jgi:hypothetical protein
VPQDGLCAKNPKSVLLHKQIEHFTSFNLVPGSSVLDNSFQNYVIFEKQLSTPIIWRKGLKKGLEFQQFRPIFLIFIFLKNNAADIHDISPCFTGTGHILYCSSFGGNIACFAKYQNTKLMIILSAK